MATTVIDDVYVLKKIGRGGMAAVFLAGVDLTSFDYSLLYAYTQVPAPPVACVRFRQSRLARVAVEPSCLPRTIP